MTCGHADELAGRQLFFKCEIFQKRYDVHHMHHLTPTQSSALCFCNGKTVAAS